MTTPAKQKNHPKANGQSQVEYALLIALVALASILTLILLGPKIGGVFSQIMNWSAEEAEEEENPGHIVVRVVDAEREGLQNVRVYAFNGSGSYQRKYGNTDTNGEVAFEEMDEGSYKFRADYQGKQFWSEVINWQGEWLAIVETEAQPFTVNVVDNAKAGIEGVRVYTFTEEGRYIGVYGNTDSNGEVIVDLSEGSYKFRADYRGNQYWSEVVAAPKSANATVETGERPFTVNVVDNAGAGVEGVRVYAFTENDRYVGVYGNTEADGTVMLDLPDGSFKFRANYRSHQYWSEVAETPTHSATKIETGQAEFKVHVIDAEEKGVSNVRVYAFSEADRYIGIYGNTDDDGVVILDIPEGTFKFRANYRSHEYWSDVVKTPDSDTAVIKTNEQDVPVVVVDGSGNGVSGVRVYAFTENGSYVGTYGNTDNDGVLLLSLPEGAYKFRANYRGNEYWSGVVNAPTGDKVIIETGEALSTIQVTDDAGQPVLNARVYAYSESDRYVGVYGNTDANGQLGLMLPSGAYRFRVDYQGSRYWSEMISTPGGTAVTVGTN